MFRLNSRPASLPALAATLTAVLLAPLAAIPPALAAPATPAPAAGNAAAPGPATGGGKLQPANLPEADALMQQADALRAKGDYAGAQAKAQEALKKQPNHVQALLLLGTLEGAQGKLDLALGHLRQAVNLSPDNLFARKVLASAQAQKGDAVHALETLAPVLKATPVDVQACLLAAQIEAGRGGYAAAHKQLDRALKADPASGEAHQLGAKLALAENHPDDAIVHLQALVKAQPDDIEAMVALASLDAAAGRLGSAASWLEKARKAKPSAPEPWMASISFALRSHHADEAAGYLPRLEALQPGTPAVLALKGEVLMAQGKPQEAIAPLQAALDKQPDSAVFVQLHQALLGANQTAEADKRLTAWIDSHPDDLRLRFYAAGAAGRRKDYAGAAAQYRKILDKDGNNLAALNDLAQTLELLKDPGSVDYAEKAWKLQPDNPVTENTLGVILMTAGKNERGLGLLRQAAEHAPKRPELRFDYARGLVATGDKAKARAELEALLALKVPFAAETSARELLKSLGGS